jgi:predicted O-methyltransferase YrrM
MTYRSNLRAPRDVEPAFVHAKPMKTYRNAPGHTVLCDPEIDAGCGYATHDEAALLTALAARLPGRWLEIGAHTGWTAAHLALGSPAVRVVALDPAFGDARFLSRTRENLERALVWQQIDLVGESSVNFPFVGFDGVFVDGEHKAPCPLLDAQIAEKALQPTGVIAFHDALGAPVQEGVEYLVKRGFKWRLYRTPQLLAVCWRGDFTPPEHLPDPSFDWAGWLLAIRFPRELLSVQS